MLTGSMFMLEVYDRVLPSRSVPTLVGFVDPDRCPVHCSRACSTIIRGRDPGPHRQPARRGAERARLRQRWCGCRSGAAASDGLQPLRDLDKVRGFLSGARADRAVRSALDAALSRDLLRCSIWIGVTALCRRDRPGRADAADRVSDRDARSRPPPRMAPSRNAARGSRAGATPRCCAPWAWPDRLRDRWRELDRELPRAASERASDVAGGLGAISKVLRMMLQSAVLAVGA